MELEDLVYESDTFYEDEQEALQNLLKNESGLDRLLEHLYRTDSFFGYMFLFEQFGDILEESVRKGREKENQPSED